MFKRWRETRQRELQKWFLDGYNAAKEEDLPLVQQAVEAGAVTAYRECAAALKSAAESGSGDAIAEVCRQIAKSARLP